MNLQKNHFHMACDVHSSAATEQTKECKELASETIEPSVSAVESIVSGPTSETLTFQVKTVLSGYFI